MGDIIVRLMDMPCYIKGHTIIDANGNYNIYINARLSSEAQHHVYEHEMNHISNGDFDTRKPIEDVEPILQLRHELASGER